MSIWYKIRYFCFSCCVPFCHFYPTDTFEYSHFPPTVHLILGVLWGEVLLWVGNYLGEGRWSLRQWRLLWELKNFFKMLEDSVWDVMEGNGSVGTLFSNIFQSCWYFQYIPNFIPTSGGCLFSYIRKGIF